MKKSVVCILALILCAISFFAGRGCQSGVVIPNSEYEVVDSTTTEATIPDTAPVPRDSIVVKYVYETIPITPPPKADVDSQETSTPELPDSLAITIKGDSAEVVIPMTQTTYETENYRAYVSGYRAKLDSLFITQPITTVRICEPTKPKRFSVGLQVGYGMTPKGFMPYVGVGVSVNLWSF